MKSTLFTVMLALSLVASVALAAEHGMHSPTTAPATKPVAGGPTTKPVNDMCAVETKNAVDDREVIFYNGKWVGFCCEDCKADFKKNPDKYMANLP